MKYLFGLETGALEQFIEGDVEEPWCQCNGEFSKTMQ